MKVIGYCRVSTREQADDGHGLAAQRRAIGDEAARRGWDVIWVEDAGFTARSDQRPGLQAALTMLRRKEAAALVVSKLDRLSRSVQHFAQFLTVAQKQHWAIIAIDLNLDMTTPNGRLVAHILAAVAQWESEMIGLRTADGMAEAKALGARFGQRQLVSPAVIARIIQARRTGASFAAIAAALDGDAVPTPNGGQRWYGSTVSRIVARQAVA